MFVVLIALAIQVVFARDLENTAQKWHKRPISPREDIPEEFPTLPKFVKESRNIDKIKFRFEDKKYLLKPSHDVLSIRYLVVSDATPTVIGIKLNDKVIYDAVNDEDESPKLPDIRAKPATDKVKQLISPDDVHTFPRIYSQDKRRGFRLRAPDSEKESCGTVKVRSTPLITYGEDTSEGEWPWHAAIYQYEGMNMDYICGGSLISRKHVLTAAHCVILYSTHSAINEELLQIYLGKHSLYRQDGHVQNRGVGQITVHPNYNNTYLTHDIAVLELDRVVEITDFVRPVCLWEEDKSLNTIVDRFGVIVGWGTDETGHSSEYLKQAAMPVISTKACARINIDYFSHFSSYNIFCANVVNGTAACTGDSGGGMVFPKTDSGNTLIWQLRGIISARTNYEEHCENSEYIVFTDVVNYLNWIKSIIQ